MSVVRDDLFAVVATGPRGAEKQRVELQTNRLQISIGPYIILGRLHTKPGTDAMASVMKREPMIPLTNVTIAYEMAGTFVTRDVGAMIVNRMLVDWISPTTDAASRLPRRARSFAVRGEDAQGLHDLGLGRALARGERAGPRVVAPRSWAIETESLLAGPDARSLDPIDDVAADHRPVLEAVA